MKTAMAVCVCLLMGASGAPAADEVPEELLPAPVPTTRPAPKVTVPDLCAGAVDPYVPGPERVRFLRAVGADNELDAKEFAAEAARLRPFVRGFDRWPAMLRFDKDRNGTIDWFECDAYRRDLRRRVLAAFDANKDGHLTGQEREAANRALAAGKLPGAATPATATRPVTVPKWTTAYRKALLKAYDRDGDGTISDDELTAMRDTRGRRLRRTWEQMQLLAFDDDGDGKLGEAEQKAWREFESQFKQAGERLQLRFVDRDGDGKVSEEERQLASEQMITMVGEMMAGMKHLMDTDGDGELSPLERADFHLRMQEGMQGTVLAYVGRYDTDGDGRLDDKQRQALLKGFYTDMDDRCLAYDVDGDGRLDSDEALGLWLDVTEEMATPPKVELPGP